MTPHNGPQWPRPFNSEQQTITERLVVNGTTIRVGDVIRTGGLDLRITNIRAVHNGRQLRFHTGELLVIKVRTELTVTRRRRLGVRR